jgi:YfiH family protein
MTESPTALKSGLLNDVGHGFFTRQGGASRGLFSSLNLGMRNADDRDNVAENRRRVEKAMDVGCGRLAIARQVHGVTCLEARHPWPDQTLPEADALLTTDPDMAVGVLTADCVPVLLACATGRVVAAVHAGWRSAKDGIIENTVAAMEGHGAERQGIRAAVGPAIAQPSYEVGQDYRTAFIADDPANERFFMVGPTGQPHFDLPGFVVAALGQSGVASIDHLERDTCAEEALFFSNRRAYRKGEKGFGLQVSVIRPGVQ